MNEIKDQQTRESLQVLPYEIKYREPNEDDLKFVGNFAKKTGDFAQLSVTDMRLIALTVRLEKEINNGVNLKETPAEIKVMPIKPLESKDAAIRDLKFFGYDVSNRQRAKGNTKDGKEKDENEKSQEKQEDEENDENEFDVDEEEEEEILIDDNEGWITKENCEEIRHKLMGIKIEENTDDQLEVGCITGDYAMQNVLLQMGLNVISPRDGLHIRQTRKYVLRCYACFKINPPNANQFCKFCGNMKTLKRVSVTVNADGTTKMHINFNKPINIRGTKYSLPMPRAGKHANNPILCEDQQAPQQRKSKLATQEKKHLTVESILNDPDYLIRSNPFSVNDVYSRGSRVNTHTRKAVNPNETRKPTGNRKKKKSNV